MIYWRIHLFTASKELTVDSFHDALMKVGRGVSRGQPWKNILVESHGAGFSCFFVFDRPNQFEAKYAKSPRPSMDCHRKTVLQTPKEITSLFGFGFADMLERSGQHFCQTSSLA